MPNKTAAQAIEEMRTYEERCADDATGDLVFRRWVNELLNEINDV